MLYICSWRRQERRIGGGRWGYLIRAGLKTGLPAEEVKEILGEGCLRTKKLSYGSLDGTGIGHHSDTARTVWHPEQQQSELSDWLFSLLNHQFPPYKAVYFSFNLCLHYPRARKTKLCGYFHKKLLWEHETLKNDCHNFREPKVMSLNCFFCPTNSPKPKDSSFTIIDDKAKQQILYLRGKKLQMFDIFA